MADTPSDQPAIGRRNFLKGVTLGGAAALAGTEARAQPAPPKAIAATLPGPKLIAAETMPPDPHQLAIAHEPVDDDPVFQSSSGGDFMVDVLKTLDRSSGRLVLSRTARTPRP
jgi:acetolactate synthase-1/2/3 large subunit